MCRLRGSTRLYFSLLAEFLTQVRAVSSGELLGLSESQVVNSLKDQKVVRGIAHHALGA